MGCARVPSEIFLNVVPTALVTQPPELCTTVLRKACALHPVVSLRIYHTVVLDDPFDDPPRLAEFIPAASPEPTKQQMDVSVGVC